MAPEAFEQIVEDFAFLGNWQDRYGYVIDLGRSMDTLEDALKVPATKVSGCASQVWIIAIADTRGSPPMFSFRGDSDALIVRGLIAILQALYNGRNVDDVLTTDAFGELGRLDLQNHLSSQRSNGLTSMVSRIRELASSLATGNVNDKRCCIN